MTAVHDVAFDIEQWRDATIQQVLDGAVEGDEEWARIGMALQDIRVRDVIAWHAVNGYAAEMYRISMTAASIMPERQRASALCIGSICSAVLGNEQLAVACANFAAIADPDYNLARLLLISRMAPGSSIMEAVSGVFGGLTLDQCRHGMK